MRELEVAKRYMLEAQAQKKLVVEKMSTIDALIAQAASSYEFQRIPHIERNILRLGVYELFYAPGLPAKVAIAEAVRLSRKFASPESASFVNAVLDAIFRSNMEGPEKNEEAALCSVRAE
jgi:N utilization substance protein B